jgi:hypothetical protein
MKPSPLAPVPVPFAASPVPNPYAMAQKTVEIGHGFFKGKKPDQGLTPIPVEN